MNFPVPFTELKRVVRFLMQEEAAVIGTGIFIALGLTAVYGDDFNLGAIALGVSAIWGTVAWSLSDKLQRLKPQPPTNLKYAKIEKYKRGRRKYLLWKFSIPSVIVLALVLSTLFVNNKKEEKILRQYEGFLLPGDKPDPPSFCTGDNAKVPPFARVNPNALKVFMGRNEAFGSHFPYVVLRVRKQDRMVIDRDDAGRIALSVDILDAQGKVIVAFEKGHFTVVQTNILDMRRPDRSTLIIRDQYKNTVLDLRYLNKKSLEISGLLRYPGVGIIPIPKASAVDGICAGESGVAFDIE
jgi:hypothetical protein